MIFWIFFWKKGLENEVWFMNEQLVMMDEKFLGMMEENGGFEIA